MDKIKKFYHDNADAIAGVIILAGTIGVFVAAIKYADGFTEVGSDEVITETTRTLTRHLKNGRDVVHTATLVK